MELRPSLATRTSGVAQGAAAAAVAAATAALPSHHEPAVAMRQPEPSGIIVGCALMITGILMVFILLKLAGVLVPLTFAVFLAFLAEPVLSAIVLAPGAVASICCRPAGAAGVRGRRLPGPPAASPEMAAVVRGRLVDVGAGAEEASGGDGEGLAEESPAAPLGGGSGTAASSSLASTEPPPPSKAWARVVDRLRTTWDVISILLCVVTLLALLSTVVLAFYASLNACDWSKYAQSPKLEELHHLLARFGVNETSWEDVIKHYESEATSVASTMIGLVGDIVVTLLLFFFCLVAILPGIRSGLPKSRMRSLMQRYLLFKTLTSLIIAAAVTLALWLLDVDLILIFGMVTFFLNFIPNIGSFISILAPAPLVYLTPGKQYNDVVLVVLVPFVIHNTLGCVLEPQLMQAGLDLHPLTVVVALTFWGAIWGIAGMVLSVPITCGIRLLLQEVDNPFAKWAFDMLDRPLGHRPAAAAARRRLHVGSPGSSTSDHESAD